MISAKLLEVGPEGAQRIDRYELVAEIASGGMATVYLARLAGVGGFQRFVAIKRLHPHLASEEEFVEMFLDEARLAAGIHHLNVVPILEVGASDKGYFIAMEYIEGDTLARLISRSLSMGQALPQGVIVKLFLEALQGLHAAHELKDERGEPTNLVHRDVSPQNILVGMDGVTRIADFGVARAASRLSATRVGQLKGKIAYMAPEQATGAESIDRRADVFAAGIVLWEALSSKRLFRAENEAATLSRVLNEKIPLLHEIASGVHPQLSLVCMKALERDPEKRFKSCAEFADTLERVALQVSKVASTREVAESVARVIGQQVTEQREAIRAWVANSSVHTGPSSVSGIAALSSPGPRSGSLSVAGSISSGSISSSGISSSGVSQPGSSDARTHAGGSANRISTDSVNTSLSISSGNIALSEALPQSSGAQTQLAQIAEIRSEHRSKWPLALGLLLTLCSALALAYWFGPLRERPIAAELDGPDGASRAQGSESVGQAKAGSALPSTPQSSEGLDEKSAIAPGEAELAADAGAHLEAGADAQPAQGSTEQSKQQAASSQPRVNQGARRPSQASSRDKDPKPEAGKAEPAATAPTTKAPPATASPVDLTNPYR